MCDSVWTVTAEKLFNAVVSVLCDVKSDVIFRALIETVVENRGEEMSDTSFFLCLKTYFTV